MDNDFSLDGFLKDKPYGTLLNEIKESEIKRRKEKKLTQKTLARETGVSYASIRRYEECGLIAFSSLLKIAMVLGSIEDFENLFVKKNYTSLEDFKDE